MKKLLLIFLLTLTTQLLLYTPTQATDLPIDIDAIGRQVAPTGRVTHRIATHLFTADAQRTNYALAQRIRQRHEIAFTLFNTPTIHYQPDPHTRIMETADNLALFTQPLNITTFGMEADSNQIPIWLVVTVLAICAIGGFLLALRSTAKKRRKNVH